MSALARTLDALVGHSEWFRDPSRPANSEAVPPIIVIDDFYSDPHANRDWALGRDYVSYVPPDPDIVGVEIGAENAYRRGRWLSTAFVTYHGRVARTPYYGERHNPDSLRKKLELAIGEPIPQNSWPHAGDYWNGAFHLVEQGYEAGEGYIHHHYKAGDLEKRGWSGVVYLSPDAPSTAETSIWRNRRTGLCVAAFGEEYDQDPAQFELAYLVENRFNRAVLFRENVWHRLEHGFGTASGARLTQTLFFEVCEEPAP